MIPKGNQRGGGRQLATHLLNQFDNDHVELVDLRGAVAQDLHGAFHEWYAQSKATKCFKYLYSLSINPDFAKYDLSREQYLDFIARTERSLKLVGQPRAIVFHVKNGREHGHVVWSRIDVEAGKAVHMAKDRMGLRKVAQEFARDHGLTLPPGMRENGRRDRFQKRGRQSDLREKQQQERSGIPKEERMRIMAAAWEKHGHDPHAFVRALELRGYQLARGDSGRYVVVDHAGEVHSLYKQIEGVKSPQIKALLRETYPIERLRDVETARAAAVEQRQANAKAVRRQHQLEKEADKRREQLTQLHQERRAGLETRSAAMEKRFGAEVAALIDLHAAEKEGALALRAARQPRGMLAFLSRITGVKAFIEARQARQDVAREKVHEEQRGALDRRHGRERKDILRESANLAAVETRERHSLELALKRQEYQKAREIAAGTAGMDIDVRAEFNRAARPAIADAGGGADKAARREQLLSTFRSAANPRAPATKADDTQAPEAEPAFAKGDLQTAFEQAKATQKPLSTSGGEGQNLPQDSQADRLQRIQKAQRELRNEQKGRTDPEHEL